MGITAATALPMTEPSAAPRARLFDDGWLSPHFAALRERGRRALETAHRLTRGESLWDWAQGHKWFGLHQEADGSWVYRDWAPYATALSLVGEFNDWSPGDAWRARRTNDRGEWELRIPPGILHPGQRYRVRMLWPGGAGDRLPAWVRQTSQDKQTHEFYAVVTAPSAHLWRHASPPCAPFMPVSDPNATSTSPAATADADPDDDPPGTRSGAAGFSGVP